MTGQTQDEIPIWIRTSPAQAAAAMMLAIRRAPGQRRRNLRLFGLVLIGSLGLGGGAGMVIGLDPATALALAAIAMGGAALGFGLALRMNGPELHRLQARDCRWQGAAITLTPEGLRIEAQTIPWDRGPEDPSQATSRMTGAPTGAPTGATVLHLGMIDTVTIPDADLPPDLTPDRLVALVQSWRSPCPPF